jgi:hypothetical protein
VRFCQWGSVVLPYVRSRGLEGSGSPSADPLTVQLDEILDSFAVAVVDATPVSDAARIDRIARLEKLRAATAALQIAESVRFAQSQVAEQMAAKVQPEAIGRGIAERCQPGP